MNYNGVDGKSQAMRLRAKTTEAIHHFRRIGLGSEVFSLRAKALTIKCFIRPRLEYSIELLNITLVKRFLEPTLNKATSMVLGVGGCAKVELKNALLGLVTMVERREIIQFSFYQRSKDKKSDLFLIANAFLDEYRMKRSKSLVKKIFKSKYVIEMKELERLFIEEPLIPENVHSPRDLVQYLKDSLKLKLWEGSNRIRKKTIKDIDKIVEGGSRRLVTMWVLRRTLGHPGWCRRCGSRLNYNHDQECLQLDISTLIYQGRMTLAVISLERFVKECFSLYEAG